jgi:hypothetical protein
MSLRGGGGAALDVVAEVLYVSAKSGDVLLGACEIALVCHFGKRSVVECRAMLGVQVLNMSGAVC